MDSTSSKQTKTKGVTFQQVELVMSRAKSVIDGSAVDIYDLRYMLNFGEFRLFRYHYLGSLDPTKLALLQRVILELNSGRGFGTLLATAEDVAFTAVDEANRGIAIQQRTLSRLASKVGLKPHELYYVPNYRELATGPFKNDSDAAALLSKFSLASRVYVTQLEALIVALIRVLVEFGAKFAAKFSMIDSPPQMLLQHESSLDAALSKWRWVPDNVATFEARVAELRRILKGRS